MRHRSLLLPAAATAVKECACNEVYDHSKPVTVPHNLTQPLLKQLVLVKVPETGSSTTAQLLADLASMIICAGCRELGRERPDLEDAIEKTRSMVRSGPSRTRCW